MIIFIARKITTPSDIVSLSLTESSLIDAGHQVMRPTLDQYRLLKDQSEFVLVDYAPIFDADAVYLPDGWRSSTNAGIVYDVATRLQKPIFFQKTYNRYRDAFALARSIVHEVTGLSLSTYSTPDRKTANVYARLIFTSLLIRMDIAPTDIAFALCRSLSTVDYYIAAYDREYNYNPSFAALAKEAELLFSITHQ